MAEICCEVVSESETPSVTPSVTAAATAREQTSSSRAARRRRMDIRRFKFVSSASPADLTADDKEHQRIAAPVFTRQCENAKANCHDEDSLTFAKNAPAKELVVLRESLSPSDFFPKYGVASVCGRRRDMEDAVTVQPSFFRLENEHPTSDLHYFGVYDGHGCSHVAMRCRERLHELVREELEKEAVWEVAMERSFTRMDKEVVESNSGGVGGASCRCELQTPDCDAVGSTAVVAVLTPKKIVVANCGDSRALLCRNGKPVPLSSDHKPDRPDELDRIQAAGGRVIYWDGPRVLGVLAMSRAIGDNYLKPYVSCEPEITVTDRTEEDDCLILGSDGLWDVVSNEMACGVARKCLRGTRLVAEEEVREARGSCGWVLGGEISDKACADASMLLTKLALAKDSTDNVSVLVVDLRRET